MCKKQWINFGWVSFEMPAVSDSNDRNWINLGYIISINPQLPTKTLEKYFSIFNFCSTGQFFELCRAPKSKLLRTAGEGRFPITKSKVH